MDTITVALQLFTVRDEMSRDALGTLRQVAALGYTAVEVGVPDRRPANEMRQLLADAGLRASGAHVRLPALTANLDGEIDYCRSIGGAFLVLSTLARHERADVPSIAARLNALGRRCRERGVTLAYHNHDFECAATDGATLLDRLLAATDPACLALELDVYWAAYAGADPSALLRRYAGRVPLVHLKDMAADRDFAAVGDGTLDMAAICAAAAEGGVRVYVVENDRPRPNGLESARRSREHVRAWGLTETERW